MSLEVLVSVGDIRRGVQLGIRCVLISVRIEYSFPISNCIALHLFILIDRVTR
jgi:hypothetical protein